jgi:hypothetical protein
MEKDEKELPFLDVLVYKEDKKLHTDIFYKSTDTHQYLNFNSCHPNHTKRNIPYSLARRISTIVSKSEIRDKRLEELENFLTAQNYPLKLIKHSINQAKSLTTTERRQTKTCSDENSNVLPLVITYNPRNPQIVQKIKNDLQFLNNSLKVPITHFFLLFIRKV